MEKPDLVGTSKQLFDRLGRDYPFSIMSEKVFFGTIDDESNFTLKVINRLELESEPRVLRTPAEEEGEEISGSVVVPD